MRRLLWTISISLALALMINAIVAVLTAWSSDTLNIVKPASFDADALGDFRGGGRFWCPPDVHIIAHHAGFGLDMYDLLARNQRYDELGHLLYWSDGAWSHASKVGPFEARQFEINRVEAGWPMRAFVGATWTISKYGTTAKDRRTTVHTLIRTNPGYLSSTPRNIPFSPLWPGLIVNTVICSSTLWAALFSCWTIRHLRRIRRGACRACGYDLTGTAHARCPECGFEPASRALESTARRCRAYRLSGAAGPCAYPATKSTARFANSTRSAIASANCSSSG